MIEVSFIIISISIFVIDVTAMGIIPLSAVRSDQE